MSVFAHQLRSEQLIFWRSREAAVFIFIFPLLLFTLLGSVYAGGTTEGIKDSLWLLGGMIGYGCANTAFAGIAISIVIRRENAILKRLRSTPLPASVYLLAMLASTMLVFALETVLLFLLGRSLFGTPFPTEILSLALAVVLGGAAFAALGVATATFIRSAEGSSAAINVILLPMAFLSGSFGPTRHFPGFLQAIADVLPLKYFIEIVDAIYLHRQQIWDKPVAVAVVAAWGLGGLLVAARRFRWEPVEG
jgi:ABC-2 type transport system permease protein